MKTNLHLYGTEDVPPLPRKAINARIKLLKEHMNELLKAPNAVGTTRVNDVVAALNFWEKLK